MTWVAAGEGPAASSNVSTETPSQCMSNFDQVVTQWLAPASVDDEEWAPLRKLTGGLGGMVPKQPELRWQEGVGIRLDWVDERLWLLLEPRTVFEGLTRENRAAATDFARERIVRRYNPALNALLEFWSMLFASPQRDLPALGISTGVNAAFRLGDVTAFSGRARA